MLSCFSRVQLFETLWTVAHQSCPSMGFSRQKYWNGLSCPPLGDLPNPGIEPKSLMSPVLAGGFFTTNATWRASKRMTTCEYITESLLLYTETNTTLCINYKPMNFLKNSLFYIRNKFNCLKKEFVLILLLPFWPSQY